MLQTLQSQSCWKFCNTFVFEKEAKLEGWVISYPRSSWLIHPTRASDQEWSSVVLLIMCPMASSVNTIMMDAFIDFFWINVNKINCFIDFIFQQSLWQGSVRSRSGVYGIINALYKHVKSDSHQTPPWRRTASMYRSACFVFHSEKIQCYPAPIAEWGLDLCLHWKKKWSIAQLLTLTTCISLLQLISLYLPLLSHPSALQCCKICNKCKIPKYHGLLWHVSTSRWKAVCRSHLHLS